MAKYLLNEEAVAKARKLIDTRQYVLDSDWGEVQPKADDQNSFLEDHGWSENAQWHLALTEGANDDTKARYAFVYGDFRRLHRTGLIACAYRASEWRHKEIELAAHELLQHLDKAAERLQHQFGGGPPGPAPPGGGPGGAPPPVGWVVVSTPTARLTE